MPGSTLTGPITPVENIVKCMGLFVTKGQDEDMKGRSPYRYLSMGRL